MTRVVRQPVHHIWHMHMVHNQSWVTPHLVYRSMRVCSYDALTERVHRGCLYVPTQWGSIGLNLLRFPPHFARMCEALAAQKCGDVTSVLFPVLTCVAALSNGAKVCVSEHTSDYKVPLILFCICVGPSGSGKVRSHIHHCLRVETMCAHRRDGVLPYVPYPFGMWLLLHSRTCSYTSALLTQL